MWNFTNATTTEFSRKSAMLVHILFGTVTFEFQHLTRERVTVYSSDGLRHGNVRIGDPRAQVLRLSSPSLLVRNPVYLVCHRLGTGLRFRCGVYVQPYSGSPTNFVVYTTTHLLTRASWASACRVVDTCPTVTTQPRKKSPTHPSTSNLSSTKHPKRCKMKVLFATLAVSITTHSVRLVKPQLTFYELMKPLVGNALCWAQKTVRAVNQW